MMYGVHNIKIN